MSVKAQTFFLRNILYIKQLVEVGKISVVAEKNGIKAPNLSKALKEMENLFNQTLFYRTPHGLKPTQAALEIALKAQKIEQIGEEIKQKYTLCFDAPLRLYISDGLEIKGLKKLKNRFENVSDAKVADVIVSAQKILNNKKMIAVEHQIGNQIKQSIWVLSKNNPQAMALAAEIIVMFQD